MTPPRHAVPERLPDENTGVYLERRAREEALMRECQSSCWGPGGEGAAVRDAGHALALCVTEVKATVRTWGSLVSILLAIAIGVGAMGFWAVKGVVADSAVQTAQTLERTQRVERTERQAVAKAAQEKP